MVHLGSRAVGGAGLVFTEATAVSPEGRISPGDAGIWNDTQTLAFAPIVKFIREHGAAAGVQLAHAGRKASTAAPWLGGNLLSPHEGGWETIGPSPVPFGNLSTPHEMSDADLRNVLEEFVAAVGRADEAGFDVIELHMAHGYLLHEFLSPLSNRRTDENGGSLENRMRYPLKIAQAARAAWPEEKAMFVRISATDWIEGGWDLEQSIEFAKKLKAVGIDLIDCSSGALAPGAQIPAGPGYQVEFAAAIKKEAQIASGAVGLIVDPFQAETILKTEQADVIFLARELLRDPYWPLHSAKKLHAAVNWPVQYERAEG